ncbi:MULTISPECIES: preprotein translocase subunit YajC [Clostridium]|uniref:Preprotein translocase subunit YajC n=1 Tax=Clostridium cibarium TaxID=2762247 RepID=A0ABR8PTP2_9CLOT|nr:MULTISPECIES: preprotein translocase subunit YajC [Clostridium]MBD7911513.1 preprotein translocase subunit YajC [Clostridium cibarium]
MEQILTFAPYLIIIAVFYLVFLVPEKKRKKQYDSMLEGLKVNDEIMTRGGIIGKIISLDNDNMVLESGPDRVRLKFSRNAIANKIYKED